MDLKWTELPRMTGSWYSSWVTVGLGLHTECANISMEDLDSDCLLSSVTLTKLIRYALFAVNYNLNRKHEHNGWKWCHIGIHTLWTLCTIYSITTTNLNAFNGDWMNEVGIINKKSKMGKLGVHSFWSDIKTHFTTCQFVVVVWLYVRDCGKMKQ